MLRERRSFGALRVALCCLLTLCGVTWCAAESVSVSGKVVDTEGNPVPGVRVRLAVVARTPPFAAVHEASQVSGKSGEYSLGPVDAGKSDAVVVAVYEPGKLMGWAICGTLEAGPTVIVVSEPTVASGVVVDEAGKPMSGVKVSYERFWSETEPMGDLPAELLTWIHPLKTMVTGEDGKYELPDVPSHMIVTPSVSKEWYGRKPIRLWAGRSDKRIVMLPAGSVTGRIIGSDGRPFMGARAIANDQEAFVGPAYTGNDGVFRVDGLLPTSYEMIFGAGDGSRLTREGVRVKAGALTNVGDIAFPATVELSGRVLDVATGKPIKGAKLSAYGGADDCAETVSGANGEYKLAVCPGKVTLCYEGGAPLYLRDTSKLVEITVSANGTRGHDIRLKKAEQAHGRVLSSTGKPAAGAIVSIGADLNDSKAVADSSGKFTIIVPKEDPNYKEADRNTVVLQAKGGKANGQGSFTYIKRDKLIKNGVTITLAPAKSVSVSVVDKAGKPIVGAEVSLNAWAGRYGGVVSIGKTDKRGMASFTEIFKGGCYSFTSSCPGYSDFIGSDEGVAANSAKWKSVHRIVMRKADQVKGTVVDCEGNPVVAAIVTIPGSHDGQRVTTDAKGAFSLLLKPSAEEILMEDDPESARLGASPGVKLMAEDKDHDLGAYVSVERTTAVTRGVRIVLKPAYELQVIVKDTSGKPVAGADVANVDREFIDRFLTWDAGVSTTDAQGIARLLVYEGMQATVAAAMRGYINTGYPLSLPAAGSKAWTGKCEIILTQLTRTVEGKVVNAAGKPVKGAIISTALANGMASGFSMIMDSAEQAPITTNAEGRFTIDLPDMIVPLRASSDRGHGSANIGRDDKTVTIIVNDR